MNTQELLNRLDVAWGRPVTNNFLEEFRESVSGHFSVEVKNAYGELMDAEYERHNIVTNDGIAYLLGVGLSNTADISSSWYLSLFSNDVTPANNWNAAGNGNPGTQFQEIDAVDVTEATRVGWGDTNTVTGTTTASITSAAAIQYTCDTAGFTAYGAFIIGTASSAFQNTTGTLYAISRFGTSKTLTDTDTIDTTYTLTLADDAT